MSKLNLDDPQMTAYALGELEGAAALEVEKQLQDNAAARTYVAELRRFGTKLEQDLAAERAPSLTEAQKASIVAAVPNSLRQGGGGEGAGGRLTPHKVGILPSLWLASAAALFMVAVVGWALLSNRQVESTTAQSKSNDVAVIPVDNASNESEGAPGPAQPKAENAYRDGVSLSIDEKFEVSYSSTHKLQKDQCFPERKSKDSSVPFPGFVDGPSLEHPYSLKKAETKVLDGWTIVTNIQQKEADHNAERYNRIFENPFKFVRGDDAVSTFSIDVDTASYSNMRRMINQGQLPPADAVRIEELVNYFSYDYAPPEDGQPFSSHVEVAECPWDPHHRLVRVGLKGKEIAQDKRPASNIVFLLDVSGSMDDANKLPLVKDGIKLMVKQLGENDTVSIVVYAGASGLVLPATNGNKKQAILDALEQLNAGGSTHGSAGIQLAYETATANFIKGGVNRVMLCTDGDWNVGTTGQGELVKLIEEKAKTGVFLSVLGFGMYNLNDAMMEQLADKGNGHYAYIDTLTEAKKVLVEEMSSTLVTIAKDVKIQVEFNPAVAGAYRLIGYENRVLAREDFNNDAKDAGEIGAGHSVTAIYEVVPVQYLSETPDIDPLKYQKTPEDSAAAKNGDLLTLKLRYKAPDEDKSKLLEYSVKDRGAQWKDASKEYRFAASVAAFGMLLRGSQYKGLCNYDLVLELAQEGLANDKSGYRAEFVALIKRAQTLARNGQ